MDLQALLADESQKENAEDEDHIQPEDSSDSDAPGPPIYSFPIERKTDPLPRRRLSKGSATFEGD